MARTKPPDCQRMLSPASNDESPTPESLEEPTEEPTEETTTTETGTEPATEAQADTSTEGGGAAVAMVSSVKRKIIHNLEGDKLVSLTVKGDDGSEIVVPRSYNREDGSYAIWSYADKQRKLANERAADAQTLASVKRLVDRPLVSRRESVPNHPFMPAQLGVVTDDTAAPASRWQTKPLPDPLRAEIESGWCIKITQHTCDKMGREFVPGGQKLASFCGGFPHAITKPKMGPHRDQNLYIVGGSHDVHLSVTLHHRPQHGETFEDPVSESEILMLLREKLPAEEVAAWGSFESSIIMYAELQFDNSVQDAASAKINTDSSSPQCAFKEVPPNGKLLSPAESQPYNGGFFEQLMSGGATEFQFKTNVNVTSSNLSEPYHARKFRLSVWCLNPYLNDLPSFRAMSLPFAIKSTLHNDLKRAERYVLADGPGSQIIPCPIDQITAFAAHHRHRRKRSRAAAAPAETEQEA